MFHSRLFRRDKKGFLIIINDVTRFCTTRFSDMSNLNDIDRNLRGMTVF